MLFLALLVGVVAAFAPGAWAAFTLGRDLPTPARVGLAIALSPFVLGAQVWALSLLGIGFSTAALAAIVLNLPALWLVWRQRASLQFTADAKATLACVGVVALGFVALWLGAPGLRLYSWHNMMQLEAVYQVAGLPRLPEEMGLGGVRLNYAWFGHIQTTAVAVLTNTSPMAVFPLFNLVNVAALLFLMVEACRALVPAYPVRIAFLTMAALLTPNLVAILVDYLNLGVVIDVRLSTVLHKFLHFDLMSNGLALFAGVIVLSLRRQEARVARHWALALLCVTAMALVYPIMLPCALVVAGVGLAMQPLAAWLQGRGFRLSWALVIGGVVLVIPIAIGAAYLALLGSGAAAVPHSWAAPWEIRLSLGVAAFASAAFLPFLFAALPRLWRERDAARLGLMLAAGVLCVAFLIVRLPVDVQYKFLAAALLCVTPLAVEQAALWLDRVKRAEVWAAGAAALLALAVAPHIVMRHVPWTHLARATPLEERGFALSTPAPELAWTDAVRRLTPSNTIVVHAQSSAPIEVLTQRAAYVAADSDVGERPGYTIDSRTFLGLVKGYPRELVAAREAVLRAIYQDANANYASIIAELAALERPVVLDLPRGSAFLQWLEQNAVGEAVYSDANSVVWLLPRP